MKRVLSLILALVMILMLVSCSQTLEMPEETKEEKTETAEKKEPKKTEEKKTEEKKTEEKKTEEVKKTYTLPDVKVRTVDMVTTSPTYGEVTLARFEPQILNFEKLNKNEKKGGIVFYGSSGFTRWTTKYSNKALADHILAKDGSKVCINRGFGGSTWHELCYYYERVIKPLAPKAIVVTVMINDLDSKYTTDEIMTLTKWFCETAQEDFPGIKIYITDVRPRACHDSDSEIANYKVINDATREYCEKTKDVNFVETSKWSFFYKNNDASVPYKNINPDMYIDDKTHYTKEGYEGFAEGFRKAIDEVL